MFLFKKQQKNVCEAVQFVYNYARKSKRGNRYKRVYRTVARHLAAYEAARGVKLFSNNFNYETAEDFVDFMKDKGMMLNTIKGYYSKTGHMYRKMGKAGYDVNYSFEDLFVPRELPESVYLTVSELLHIANMDIIDKNSCIVRDIFVLNSFLGMRFGDFKELNETNISGNIIYRKTSKTGESVFIPIHPVARGILNKYDGRFPVYRYSVQNYNVTLKRICRRAGLTEKVLWERTVGHRIVRKTIRRYELVSSHTARRSFATNAYLAGIPVARIMLLTGHKTEESFFRYIRISKKENARELSEHPFFM